jgi:uncharacterized protein with HEPN domain
MSKQLRVLDYLGHIRDAIERIQRYTEDMDEAAFLQNEMAQDAVIRNIEIIGEAANNIRKNNPDFAAHHSEIPWAVMYAMRNRLAHAYHKVDYEIVWKTVQNELSVMLGQLKNIQDGLSNLQRSASP